MSINTPECYADDFFEQILSNPYPTPGNEDSPDSATSSSMMLQLNPGNTSGHLDAGVFQGSMFPLGLSLDSGFTSPEAAPSQERESVQLSSLCSAFGHVQPYSIPVRPTITHTHQAFHRQPNSGMNMIAAAPQPPAVRPRVRARRGQATDPHSIAERVRRERISEKVKALQELVPSCSKTDRAAMFDGILDYVKFLRLQVKVLSMSRLGGAGAVAQLVSDASLQPSVQGGASEDGSNQQPWDKWSNESTEQEVLKLMEEDVGLAMQFLQSKALCIMPVSLAAAIYSTQQQPESSNLVKLEPNPPS